MYFGSCSSSSWKMQLFSWLFICVCVVCCMPFHVILCPVSRVFTLQLHSAKGSAETAPWNKRDECFLRSKVYDVFTKRQKQNSNSSTTQTGQQTLLSVCMQHLHFQLQNWHAAKNERIFGNTMANAMLQHFYNKFGEYE